MKQNDRLEVVITGTGALACNGRDTRSFWNALIAGRDGYSGSADYLPADYPFKVVGKIRDPQFEKYLSLQEQTQYDRATQLGLAAAAQALESSQLLKTPCKNKSIAVIMGTTCGTNLTVEEGTFEQNWFQGNKADIAVTQLGKYGHVSLANAISGKYGFSGPSYIIGTACSSGSHAIGEAYDLIRNRKARQVICGGADSLSLLPIYGFHSMLSLSDDKCTPFDKDRKGMIVGEGAAVLVLESEESALERNAPILAKVAGWSLNCDARKFAAPITSGERCEQLIKSCLMNSGLAPADIDYINLHGTGTKMNDLMEVTGIKRVLHSEAARIPVSSIKSMIGHCLGAAGALEGVASVLAINHNLVPPNIHLEQPDEGFDLNFVTEPGFRQNVKTVLSLSFAFGGCNVAIAFSEYNKTNL